MKLEVDLPGVLGAAGKTLLVIGAAQLAPVLAALAGSGPWWPLLVGAAGTVAAGVLLLPLGRGLRQWRRRESLAVASLSWALATAGAAVPFVAAGACGPIDALFESASGLTTTGATVFADVDGMHRLPRLELEAWDPLLQRGYLSGAWYDAAPGRGQELGEAARALGLGAEVRPRRDPAGRLLELLPAGPHEAPHAAPLHLWRAICHWLGGAGIVLLVLVLLPWLGQGEALLRSQRAEASFLTERYRGSTRATVKGLLVVYVGATSVLIAALLALGVGPWSAVLHAFATISTGGFSPHTASLGAYGPAVQLVVTAFMAFGALNFAVLGRTMDEQLSAWRRAGRERGPLGAAWVVARGTVPGITRAVWRSSETRAYLFLLAGSAAAIAALLVLEGDPRYVGASGARGALLDSTVTAVSISTTTGFCTADFGGWPPACQVILVGLMLVGGCSGSTAGGLKMRRVLLASYFLWRELRRLPRPNAVMPIKLGGTVVPEEHVREAVGFIAVYLLLVGLATLLVAGGGTDLLSAGSSAVASLGSVGPGLGLCGPSGSFSPFDASAKLVLTVVMLLGRLEILAPLAVSLPSFWLRRRTPGQAREAG